MLNNPRGQIAGALMPQETSFFGNLYPEGWKGGLFGMGNPVEQNYQQQQAQRNAAQSATLENYQRGREDPTYAALAARLAQARPSDSTMANAFGGPSVMGRIAYHGTPATFAPTATNQFGEFLTKFLNKGEGNQAYGVGTYLAESKPVAQKYAEQLAKDGRGNVYTAEIPDAGYLKWDAPVAQSPEAAKALGLEGDSLNMTGQQVYEKLWKKLWADHIKQTRNNPDPKFDPRQAAAQELNKLGIHGIEYLDSASRGMGSGTSNFVLFDPSVAKITGRE